MSLKCTEVSFSYGDANIFTDISFEVERGVFCGLLGSNGSGKTTLLHCLNGLLKPQRGRIEIDGLDIGNARRKTIARKVSLVSQEHVEIFPFTALDVVVMGRTARLGFTQRPGKNDYEAAREMLALLDVSGLAHRSFNQISGGERQIVLLARALVQSSATLLLDEPTNHLDFKNQYVFLHKIKQYCRDRGTRVIAAMHDPNMARLFADQIVMLKKGEILINGPARDTMTAANISRLYNTDTRQFTLPFGANLFLPELVCGRRPEKQAAAARVILVTGDKHIGKTTLVERYIASLNGRNIKIAGILAKGLWENNLRAGFDLVNLSDGSTTPLARRRKTPDPKHGCGFDFFDTGFQAGAAALAPAHCRDADIVVVDEVGKLEARGEGWAPRIKPLLGLEKPLFIWCTRMDCLPQICERFDLKNPPIINVQEPGAFKHLQTCAGQLLERIHPQ